MAGPVHPTALLSVELNLGEGAMTRRVVLFVLGVVLLVIGLLAGIGVGALMALFR